MTSAFKLLVGVLLLGAALLSAPAVAPNVLAGAAGLVLLGIMTPAAPTVAPPAQPLPTAIVRVAPARPDLQVFELDRGAGIVVFREVDGKLVSRFFRV